MYRPQENSTLTIVGLRASFICRALGISLVEGEEDRIELVQKKDQLSIMATPDGFVGLFLIDDAKTTIVLADNLARTRDKSYLYHDNSVRFVRSDFSGAVLLSTDRDPELFRNPATAINLYAQITRCRDEVYTQLYRYLTPNSRRLFQERYFAI